MSYDQSFACSRRKFWRALLQEAVIFTGSLKGRQGCKLSELDSLPDDQLAEIRPVVNPKCKIFIDEGYVCSRDKQTEITLKLFPREKEYLLIFNMFNGRHSLGEIGHQAALDMGWEKDAGFTCAKKLFLDLARCLVCLPQNSSGPAE